MANAKIIKILSKQLKLPISRIEAAAGINAGTLSKAIKEEKELSSMLIGKISKWNSKINVSWLLTGEGPIFGSTDGLESNQPDPWHYKDSEMSEMGGYREKYIRLLEQINNDRQRKEEDVKRDIKSLEASHDKLLKTLEEQQKKMSLNLAIADDERREIMIVSRTTLLLLQHIASLLTQEAIQHFEIISSNIRSAVEQEYDETDSSF